MCFFKRLTHWTFKSIKKNQWFIFSKNHEPVWVELHNKTAASLTWWQRKCYRKTVADILTSMWRHTIKQYYKTDNLINSIKVWKNCLSFKKGTSIQNVNIHNLECNFSTKNVQPLIKVNVEVSKTFFFSLINFPLAICTDDPDPELNAKYNNFRWTLLTPWPFLNPLKYEFHLM